MGDGGWGMGDGEDFTSEYEFISCNILIIQMETLTPDPIPLLQMFVPFVVNF
jgi:hypothetical protein